MDKKKLHSILAYLLPQPRDILVIGVFLSLLLGGPKLFTNDGDLGRHITIGNYILDTKTIPTSDIFSNTLYGTKLVSHEWLSAVVFALAWRWMGLSGDVLITALLASLTIFIIHEELIKRGNHRLVVLFVCAWVAMVSSIHWLARPHMFTFFFIALWTYWLEDFYKNDRKKSWAFPILMLVWANTHGAFISGFVVLGAYIVDWLWGYLQGVNKKETGKKLLLISLLSFAVTFINPSGIYLWATSIGYISNHFMTSHTIEYLSPDFHTKDMWPFMFMVAFALFAQRQERKIQLREALLLTGWTVMSLYSVRNMPLFAVITAPIYGTLIQPWAEKILNWKKYFSDSRDGDKVLRGYVWIIVPILFLGFALWRGVPLDQNGTGNIFSPDKMPVEAVDWLKKNPQDGPMFNQFTWGGYILYRMWPDKAVFIDGQTDFYGETLMREYLSIISLDSGWESILDNHKISWMIIPRNEPLAKYLYSIDSDAWHVIYEDNTAVIFRRDKSIR